MPHSFGYRARTRDLFSKKKGEAFKTNTILKTYKIGCYVDVLCDPGTQKGMPFKFYYGKTGKVWNVSKRAVGIEMFKKVGNRLRRKKIHVRIEHIRPSKCKDYHNRRVKENEILKKKLKDENKETSVFINLKRKPAGPQNGYLLKKKTLQ